MKKSIVIIGAGISGLAAGCYARMNGYSAKIFEMHDKPGGLCTSWKKGEYIFEGCIHWLGGSSPRLRALYDYWEELGAVQGRTFIDHDVYRVIEAKQDKKLIVYTNADRLEKELLTIAPADAKPIRRFIHALKTTARAMHSGEPERKKNPLGIFKLFPFLLLMLRWRRTSTQEYARYFQDPFLRRMFPRIMYYPDLPMVLMLISLAWMHNRSAGYPLGGSLPFIRAIEQRFLALGGEIQYRTRVADILVEKNRACGVRLSDGSDHQADIVISAADGHATIFELLHGKYATDSLRTLYRDSPLFPPIVQVSFGVARDLSREPPSLEFALTQTVRFPGIRPFSELVLQIYNFDPTLSPKGKTAVTLILPANYDYWKALRNDRAKYNQEKKKLGEVLSALMEQRFPGFIQQVEVTDVATPATYERYTGNWKASFGGFLPSTKNLLRQAPKTLPGLENFYMVGQWVSLGGGVPSGPGTAKDVLKRICRADRLKFKTSKPK